MSDLQTITAAPRPQWQNCTGCGLPFDFTEENFRALGKKCRECESQGRTETLLAANDRKRRSAVEGFLTEVRRGATGSALMELHADVMKLCGGREGLAEYAREILVGAVEAARATGRWKTAIDAYKALIINPMIADEANRPRQQFNVTEEEAEAIIRECMLRDAEESDDTLRRLAAQKGFRLIPASGHEPGEEVRDAG